MIQKLLTWRKPQFLIRSFCYHSHYQLYLSMKDCSSIPIARKLHAQLISKGLFNSSIFLQNNLLKMYFKCHLINEAIWVFDEMSFRNVFTYNAMISGLSNAGFIVDAYKVFDEMPERDSVSWNSIMSGYFRNGEYVMVLKVFLFMFQSFICGVNLLSFSCAMKACGALGYLGLAFQLHGLVEKFDYETEKISLQNSILDMYVKCGAVRYAERLFLRIRNPSLFCFNSMLYVYANSYGVGKALDFFNRMSERNAVSWSTMISILSRHGYGVVTLRVFVEMWTRGFRPDSMTLSCVLSACSSICDLQWGTHLHARILRIETFIDAYIGNGLIDMYAKCGLVEYAKRVFNNLHEQNVVSWTSLINGIAQCGLEEDALLLFKTMRDCTVAFDEFTLATVLKVCSHSTSMSFGRQLHAITIKSGMGSFITMGNALISMYAKCGDTQKANFVFQMMEVRNIVTWTSMITSFSQAGDVKNAQACFDKMPERNVITWNAMMSMYFQLELWEYSLKLYVQMQREGILPDDIAFATSIGACADLAMLKLGIQIVAQSEKSGYGSGVSVANCAISLYSRCGKIEEARKVFDLISLKNLVSWNSMIAGYSQNGHGTIAIEMFKNMLKMEYAPDHISFLSVLSGCSYEGLVTEGKHLFESMSKDYGISPTCEHFTCMVDMFGRAGLLDQAKSFIDEMPCTPNAHVWGALLNACKIYGNSRLAEHAERNLLELGFDNSGSYLLLTHIYSGCGRWEDVLDIRKLMKEKGIQKKPGYSWIEVDNQAHVFAADEIKHPQIKEIYSMMDIIFNVMMDEARKKETT